MALHVTCPSCKSETAVDETLAGREVLCPNCRERVTVPSLAAGRPDAKVGERAAAWDDDEDDGRGDRSHYGDRGARSTLPRYRDGDDYDLPARRAAMSWSATATGLALIFWAGLGVAVLATLTQFVGLAMGQNPGMLMGPGAGPQPQAMALMTALMGLGCLLFVALIVVFVGACMCCTAPAASGAKGRAIAAVIVAVLLVVGLLVVGVAGAMYGVRQAQRMGAPMAPGQLPFAPTALILFSVGVALAYLLLATLWLLFHKAVADYFGNRALARGTMWLLFGFIVYLVGSQALTITANPQLMQGNFLAQGDPALMLLSTIWGLVGWIAVAVGFLVVVQATRRTILAHAEPASYAD